MLLWYKPLPSPTEDSLSQSSLFLPQFKLKTVPIHQTESCDVLLENKSQLAITQNPSVKQIPTDKIPKVGKKKSKKRKTKSNISVSIKREKKEVSFNSSKMRKNISDVNMFWMRFIFNDCWKIILSRFDLQKPILIKFWQYYHRFCAFLL